MNANPNVAMVATLVSEASRAAILTVLFGDRYHLTNMVDANIVIVEKQGRHRYYIIKNQEIDP